MQISYCYVKFTFLPNILQYNCFIMIVVVVMLYSICGNVLFYNCLNKTFHFFV